MILSFIVCLCLIVCVFITYKYPVVRGKNRLLNVDSRQMTIVNLSSYVILLLVFSIILGFRYDVGIDYLAYQNLFVNDISTSLKSTYKNVDTEWLFTILSFLIKKMGGSYRSFFFIYALIFSCFYILFLRREKEIATWIILCTIFSGVLFWCLGFLRQGVSFSILLYATSLLSKKRKYAFIALTLLAAGFHLTSLLFLIVIPFRRVIYKAPTTFFLRIILVLYILTYMFNIIIESLVTDMLLNIALVGSLSEKYGESFASWRISVSGSGLGLLARHLIDISLILLTPILGRKDSKSFKYFYLYVFGALQHNVFEFNVLLLRIPVCFDFMFVVYAAYIFQRAFIKWKTISRWYKSLALFSLLCFTGRFVAELKDNPYSFFE